MAEKSYDGHHPLAKRALALMTHAGTNTKEKASTDFRYILVGNIIDRHYYGENKTIRRGAKHFRPGAKVYLLPQYAGMGHENIPVYGLPRKSWGKIEVVIRATMIKNARVKKTYDPILIEKVSENQFYRNGDLVWLNRFAKAVNKGSKEIDE